MGLPGSDHPPLWDHEPPWLRHRLQYVLRRGIETLSGCGGPLLTFVRPMLPARGVIGGDSVTLWTLCDGRGKYRLLGRVYFSCVFM